MQLGVIVTLISYAVAQVATCTTSKNPTFNSCIRNQLVDTAGQVMPTGTEIQRACNALQNEQQQYFSCLCDKYQAVVNWY